MQFAIDQIKDAMAEERTRKNELATQRNRIRKQLDAIEADMALCDRNLEELRAAQVKLAKV